MFCASSPGTEPVYRQVAIDTGRLLVQQKLELVYGGAQVGLMGAVANAVLDGGLPVIGVIPHFLSREEIAHHGLTELILVESMHERKLKMSELADGFIALPGGFGTLEELFEIVTWAQLGLHDKPIGIVNVAGYYDFLINQLDHMVTQGLLKAKYRDMLLFADTPEAVLELMRAYEPPQRFPLIDSQDRT